MELSKHKNHRSAKYLNWLRQQNCAVSGLKAECAHHIRLGTNGGTSLKPSDYFCIPLLNEYHVSGPEALHVIGEDTFLARFGLDPQELFIKYLKKFLIETFEIYYMLENRSKEETIDDLIGLIVNKLPKMDRPSKKRPSIQSKAKSISKEKPAPSITENEFYQKAKELKKERDKELRQKLKAQASKNPSPSFKGNEFYEKSKELKRERDKELRAKLKNSDHYEAAKAKKRMMDKEFRKKAKARKESFQESR